MHPYYDTYRVVWVKSYLILNNKKFKTFVSISFSIIFEPDFQKGCLNITG